MKISTKHGFLFVHIPRTAGSSISGALDSYCIDERKRYPFRYFAKLGWQRDWKRRHFNTHAPLSVAQRYIPAEEFSTMCKFAVVRNPWDQLMSRFWHRIRRDDRRWYRRGRRSPHDFMEFLRIEAGKIGRLPSATQFDMISTSDGRIGVDCLMRFENLADDWLELMQKLGLDAQLPHWNWVAHPARQEFYSSPETALVARHWACDIEAFGYSFDD